MIVFVAEHGFAVVGAAKAVMPELLDFYIAVFVGPERDFLGIYGPVRAESVSFARFFGAFAIVIAAGERRKVHAVSVRGVEEYFGVGRIRL